MLTPDGTNFSIPSLAAWIICFAPPCERYKHNMLAAADLIDLTAKARQALASPDHALHSSPKPRPVSINQEDLKMGQILGKGSFAVVSITQQHGASSCTSTALFCISIAHEVDFLSISLPFTLCKF